MSSLNITCTGRSIRLGENSAFVQMRRIYYCLGDNLAMMNSRDKKVVNRSHDMIVGEHDRRESGGIERVKVE